MNTTMKASILIANLFLLLLVGCTNEYPKVQIGITHAHIFKQAEKLCKSHGGTHYIVTIREIYSEYSDHQDENFGYKDYPCNVRFKVRCEDQVLLEANDEVIYCFINQLQLEETLDEDKTQ